MRTSQFKLTLSFQKKSNQVVLRGRIDSDTQVGSDKGQTVTMYVALIYLGAASIKIIDTIINLCCL